MVFYSSSLYKLNMVTVRGQTISIPGAEIIFFSPKNDFSYKPERDLLRKCKGLKSKRSTILVIL